MANMLSTILGFMLVVLAAVYMGNAIGAMGHYMFSTSPVAAIWWGAIGIVVGLSQMLLGRLLAKVLSTNA